MKVSRMIELTFITDLVEEQLIKGRFRWLANFNEIRRDYSVEDTGVSNLCFGRFAGKRLLAIPRILCFRGA